MDYEEIANLIEKGELEQAQKELDNDHTVSAEWFYLQSWIQYELGWYLDSKNNLEQALLLDPDSELYRERYERLLKQGEIESETKTPEDAPATKSKKGNTHNNKRNQTPKGKIKESVCDGLCEGCAYGGGECCCQCCFEGLAGGC